ncbi:cobalamin B12-binding domain-containing protein [Amycolatopsis granulosa]|uniref:cobalamin B12-binding domain-containing protein n=1 Tax=Amycolatopsis granulosa TaxID=185684 RepID=UPI001422C9EB|nr:cobalamin-dependent protein [Amycolatopsis granulosa]NIH83172.1 methanogenic corrinoid protein MtbC1 [Amycolatopsis granulosa]
MPGAAVQPAGTGGTTGYAERLWHAVLDGDQRGATGTVLAALAGGLDPESVLLDVIGAVQRRVGQEWAANRISVAQEHTATAINERAIAGLAREAPRPAARLGRVTVSCVDGEWHALPARLLAEVLELRGFRVNYLGAQVPAQHLITHLHRTSPDAVALSSSLPTRLPAAHATITACQAAGVPVIAGGAAFGPDGRWARLLGAEAWAPDARTAADRLAGDPLPRPRAAHQPIDDLPHLTDQEYTLVRRSSPQLVRAVYAGLEQRVPGMRGYTELQRQHTTEDLAHIVDFLAAALYTGDASLFTSFLTWTADILTARAVPAGSLVPALDLLTGELRDFPRAAVLLERARTGLAGHLAAGR